MKAQKLQIQHVMSILKELPEKDERLEHTDVCYLITDGEGSGLRGALAYAKARQILAF